MMTVAGLLALRLEGGRDANKEGPIAELVTSVGDDDGKLMIAFTWLLPLESSGQSG